MPYDLEPRYPVSGGVVEYGYAPLVAAANEARVIAIDGPAAAPWKRFISDLAGAFRARRVEIRVVDARDHVVAWPDVEQRTDAAALRGDPVFATIHDAPLASLFETLPAGVGAPDGVGAPGAPASDALTLVFGPGSALFRHDVLWYADLPKRLGLEAIEAGVAPNLGQPGGARGDVRRLLFIDWPMEDRHRRELAERWDRYIDLSDPAEPRSLDAGTLSASLRHLVSGPFRTRPSFLPEPWGGRWLSDKLGAPGGPKLGLGYELIAPEAGVLLGTERPIEVALDVVVSRESLPLLGTGAAAGPGFPIRFDYLDTVGGGDLSVHCHPGQTYMREVFGHPVAQHETYYVMVDRAEGRIFLGLREDTDVAAFRSAAELSLRDRAPLDIERFVQTVPARRHQLYLVPAGTPHGSREGMVVLEISATPYLYSLRFYDWLREDLDGDLRPVQLDHAFANLVPERRGTVVPRDLVPEPIGVREGDGYTEVAFPRHPELFFSVHRIDFSGPVPDRTGDRFHVLNLVEGGDIEVRTADGRAHRLRYAETIVVPAAVGRYELVPLGDGPRKVVKAFVV
jgi:mannose-6-phosphate isomerase class I